MLTLRVEVFKEKFELAQEICDKFKKPVIFYLRPRKDMVPILAIFVIVDFKKKELLFIDSYLEENIKKINHKKWRNTFKHYKSFSDCHSFVKNEHGNDFYTFLYLANYFCYINYEKKIIRFITGKDLSCDNNKKIKAFGATHFKDSQDPRFFYLSASEEKINGKIYTNIYKASFDLKKIEKIFPAAMDYTASLHSVTKYKNHILSASIADVSFRVLATGEILNGFSEICLYVFRDLFKKHCYSLKKKFYEKDFLEAIKISPINKNYVLEAQFEKFVKLNYGNVNDFVKIYKGNEKYKSTLLPGKIRVCNVNSQIAQDGNVSVPAPGHFEINTKNNSVYVSSHNLVILDYSGIILGGSAALDKFSIGKNGLKKTDSFRHPFGFKFTSHRVFYFEGKEYLCTLGAPNRLFVINAKNMKLVYYKDIGKKYLSGINPDKIEKYLDIILRPASLALEVSSDGRFILMFDYEGIIFFDIKERKIIDRIGLMRNLRISDQFVVAVVHCQYFD